MNSIIAGLNGDPRSQDEFAAVPDLRGKLFDALLKAHGLATRFASFGHHPKFNDPEDQRAPRLKILLERPSHDVLLTLRMVPTIADDFVAPERLRIFRPQKVLLVQ
jgi:hypothetical protein